MRIRSGGRLLGGKSIAYKASLLQIVIITITFVCSSFLSQQYSNRIITSEVNEVSMINLESVSNNVNATIKTMDTYSRLCLSNSTVQNNLSAPLPHRTSIYTTQEMQNLLTGLIANVDLIDSIYVADQSNFLYWANKQAVHLLTSNDVSAHKWYGGVTKDKGLYSILYDSEGFQGEGEQIAFSLVRVINSMETMLPIGYLILNVSKQAFLETLNPGDMDSSLKIQILLPQKAPIYQSKDFPSGEDFSQELAYLKEQGLTSRRIRLHNESYSLSCYIDPETGIEYNALIEINSLAKDNRQMLLIFLALWGVQTCILMMSAVLVVNWFNKPIRKLMHSIAKVQHGVFEPLAIQSNHYEIQALIGDYNKMIVHIQKLLEQTVHIEQEKRKADLRVLNMQMNPHFLYNTFDSIKSLILLERFDDAYQMMASLSKFYKINLSKGMDMIPLQQEIEMTRQYLHIQQMRYRNEFEVEFDIAPALPDCLVPKLVLQPLVENAIYHGIRGLEGERRLLIQIHAANPHTVRICVEDNGRGMTERYLQRILRDGEDQGEKSFGLMGTLRRLEYYFGSAMKYKIESRVNIGTAILLTIPAHNKNPEGNESC